MRILITTTLNNNLTEAKLKPLVALDKVQRIFIVSDIKGPYFPKAEYYNLPPGMLRFFSKGSFVRFFIKFFTVLYVSIFKRPDLLMGYTFMPHGINALVIGKLLRKPVIINVIGGARTVEGGGLKCVKNVFLRKLGRPNSLLERGFLKLADTCDFITATGNVSRDFLVSKGISMDKAKILPSAVDTNRFFPNGCDKEYDLITVANLIPLKRVDMFLNIVARLTKDHFKVNAVILGRGRERRYLEKMSRALGISDSVRFVGYDACVEKYLRRSKVFLLTSMSEGLSLAMLEAMACGVVPIVSNVGDLGDAVKDGINGRLVERDDMDGFVSAVSGLLKDPETLHIYSESCVRTIKEGYSVENIAEKWRQMLSALNNKNHKKINAG